MSTRWQGPTIGILTQVRYIKFACYKNHHESSFLVPYNSQQLNCFANADVKCHVVSYSKIT